MEIPTYYIHAMYRKDNRGNINIWYAKAQEYCNSIYIYHGILGKKISIIMIECSRDANAELKTKINEKHKQGYKFLNEIRDDLTLPVKEELYQFLTTYLEDNRTTVDGTKLPMLAKVYDNKNNNVFKYGKYYGQWKINGLRCLITPYKTNNIFQPIGLKFQSREGIYWNSLGYLEQELLELIPKNLLNLLMENEWSLDGEVYIPGMTVNDINSAVKNITNPNNTKLQYWCYDIACENEVQKVRTQILDEYLYTFKTYFNSKQEHINNTNKLIYLPYAEIDNGEDAIKFRDTFISLGFEGLILRNINAEYTFGARAAGVMVKYKKSTDGIFTILDIYPEGVKRNNIPLFKCLNDINNETFEVHISLPVKEQTNILLNKDVYIGRKLLIEFGERAGVNQVPFHVKNVSLIY